MLGDIHANVITVALVFLVHLGTICSAENDLSLVKLPAGEQTSDYVSWCFFSQHGNLTCNWTSSHRSAPRSRKQEILTSHPLAVVGKVCLEFWHLVSDASRNASVRALLNSSLGQLEIWTPLPLSRDGWRHVSVPLNITEQGTQVIFEAFRPLTVDQKTLRQIGVRKGSCRHQCESNAELWTDDTTRCLCSGYQFFCLPSQCPKDQTCDPLDGPRKISPSGVCTIHRNTDCHTFDGVAFRLMSPCTYVLAKTCTESKGLLEFYVEVVNVQTDNESLPTIQQINVGLGNVKASLLKGQMHRAVVHGVWQELPLSLNNDTVHIKSNPAVVVMGSSSGVSVSYDNTGAVQVRIPLQYSDGVCGLCGNFNQLPGDDFLKPDGTKADDATALVKSWETGGNVSSCESIKVPQHCDALDKALYSSENYCGLLHASAGPFAPCLPVVGADSFFRGCLLGLCSAPGDKNVLCDTLQAYANICQKAGIVVPTWRNSTFCSLECGKNSHYNSCANGCSDVCSSLDQAGFCGSCEGRCQCDPGFKISGDACVTAEDCGCWYKGKHYKKGAVTVEGNCEQECQCVGNDNMECTAIKCSSDEVCKEKNGIKGCFPFKPATCHVYGDPHYVTFDKLAYSFQGGCAYILTSTCGEHSTVQFTVTGFNSLPADQNSTRSKLEAVALQLNGLDLALNQSGEVLVYGNTVSLPYSTNGSYGSVWVYVNKDFTTLETTFGLKIGIDGHSRLFLQVDESYKYELCGLCGTYSGYQEDDFLMPGGHIATESFEFGDSWRIPINEGCTASPNDTRKCVDDEENMANEECSMVFQGAFEACHEHVHPSIFFSSCVYDYCATAGNPVTLCESLKSYATACKAEGVELSRWQTGTQCDFSTAAPTTRGATSPDQTFCPINCSFDTNLCEWEQLIQDSLDWTRHSGSTPSNLTGPNQDHTTGGGFYMYLEGDGVTHGDSARMMSSSCQLDGPVCFHFWYYMYGSATGMALNIYKLQGNQATKIWSTMNNQGPEWHLGKADLKISGSVKFIIEGIRGSTAQSDVAIDDITITFGSCSDAFPNLVGTTTIRTTAVAPPYPVCNIACSFKNSLCTWSQMVTDAFDWTMTNVSTPTEMTGPSCDHTGDGHYIYIEATKVTYGDTARLISSKCTETGPHCLQFWYHMYGSAETMGLNIYILQNKTSKEVWQKRNNQGNVWHHARVDLNTTVNFQIILEGRRGSNDQSDVAIDDITLYHGRCTDQNELGTASPVTTEYSTTAKPSVALPSTATPEVPLLNGTAQVPTANVTPENGQTTVFMQNVTKSPGQAQHPVCNLDCNFEQDFCQWSQMLTVFDWERLTGSTHTLNKGLLSDHATGDGHYLHIEANGASLGDTARLISTKCLDPGPQCLEFWYRIYGSADMCLNVYLLQDGQATVVWRRNYQENVWNLAQVDLVINGTFQIIFEGRISSNEESDVAIDDIRLSRGFCQDFVTQVTDAPGTLSTTDSPQVSATTKPEPSNGTVPQASPTGGPHPPTTAGNVAATTTPVPSNGTVPQPSPTVAGNVTATPQVPATTIPVPSNETGPQPSPTAGPLPPTAAGNVTATTIPVPANGTGPQPSPTVGNPPPTTSGNATATPQGPATTTPVPANGTVPQPSPTVTGNVTGTPQVPATTIPEPSNETGPQPSPTAGPLPPTAAGNVTATTTPVPANGTVPQPSPTVAGNVTATPQVPATSIPVPSNETGPQPSPTAGPLPPTAAGNVTATTIPVPANVTVPQPSPTVGNPPPTTGNATATPQGPATTIPVPSNETVPQPSPTAGPLPTAAGNVTATTIPKPPNETGTILPNPTSSQTTIPSTSESIVPMLTDFSTPKTTRSPQQTVVPQPGTTHVSTPSCAENSHYAVCIPTCSPTCEHLDGPPHCNVQRTCISGCVCDDGFVLKGSVCVPVHKCGCVGRNGIIHKFGEVWYTNHCSQKCECEEDDGEGQVECEETEGCEDDTICLQSEMGEYYCESTDFGECTIKGNPEYNTFDKLKHEFSGTDLYVLVRTKNLPKNLPDIYIMGTTACSGEDIQNDDSSEENDESGSEEYNDDDTAGHKQKLQELKINVYNHTIELKHKRKVLVDGQRVKFPGTSSPGFKILMRSSNIYLKTDFGLSVEFKGHCKTDIIVPFLYKRRVEGLCGNFDGRKLNDKVKPDGAIAKNTQEFGESWRV